MDSRIAGKDLGNFLNYVKDVGRNLEGSTAEKNRQIKQRLAGNKQDFIDILGDSYDGAFDINDKK